MNEKIIKNTLRCPVCGGELGLSENGRSLVCYGARPHLFDIASAGYVNLAGPKYSGSGDSKALVRSRSDFLRAGHYEKFADAICRLAKKYADGGVIVDAGCGEGYYTLKMAEFADVCGIDLSKFAVEAAAKYASREGKNAAFCVAGIFDMPLKDGSADAVVNIFAPCAPTEFARVLKDGGYLITAGAGEDHLYSLKAAIYDEPTKNSPREDLPRGELFEVERERVQYTVRLSGDALEALFYMTPYSYRTGEEGIARLRGCGELDVTLDFEIIVYRKRGNEK